VGAAGAVRGAAGGEDIQYSIFNKEYSIFKGRGGRDGGSFDRINRIYRIYRIGFFHPSTVPAFHHSIIPVFVIPMFQHSNIPVFVFDRINRIFQDLQDWGISFAVFV
jgi:hypothetical protein